MGLGPIEIKKDNNNNDNKNKNKSGKKKIIKKEIK